VVTDEEAAEFGPAVAQAAAAGHEAPSIVAKGLQAPARPQHLAYSAPDEVGEAEVRAEDEKAAAADPFAGVSRNAECPCGSGKKYKKCHGAPGGPTGLTTRVNG
jgi:preprotein translocase subunit SecA